MSSPSRHAAVAAARAVDAGRLKPMTASALDMVMEIEHAAYALPWTRGNFIDSLASGYFAHCLLDECDRLMGYCVAMQGVDEMHLLNLTVAPALRCRGHARRMLDVLVAYCQDGGMAQLWLEVRVGNATARRLYRRYGFAEAGLRKAYYPPTPAGLNAGREDAVIMRLSIQGPR